MLNRLKRVISLFLITSILLMYFTSLSTFAACIAEKHILFLAPFTPDYPGIELYHQGLKSTLAKDLNYKFSYSYEYLDLERYPNDEDYLRNTAKYFKAKYLTKQPDFIVTSSDLYSVFTKYGNAMFPNVLTIMDWNVDNQALVKVPSNYIVIPRLIKIKQYVGSGVITEYVNDLESIGQNAASVVLDIVAGEKSTSGNKIQYIETNVWDLYNNYIIAGIVLLGMQAFLIFNIYINRRKRKRSENELIKMLQQTQPEQYKLEIKSNNCFDILVADDDPKYLSVITNILALQGYRIKGVNNGQAVLDLLNNGCQFDLLILDIIMRGITDLEVLKTLRQRYSYAELPVLILTGQTWNEALEIGLNFGANDFLNKPFESRELRARVKTLVQLKQVVSDNANTELLFLQAQIKPHFIFNALSVISSLSLKNPEKAKDIVLDLSDYLRRSFDFESSGGLTTLSNELQLVRAYLAIEQARFKDRLEVRFNIEEGVECKIPMLSIQILVENSVRHGIMQLTEGGRINVNVRTIGKFVNVAVNDNGVGMDIKKVENILSGEVKKGSVGLRNINRRLIALYGRGIKVTANEENGTTVEFEIPCRERV